MSARIIQVLIHSPSQVLTVVGLYSDVCGVVLLKII